MLFRQKHLKGIQSGDITLAFRKWKRAAVREGSLIHTAIGLVKIEMVSKIEEKSISNEDANKAGFSDKKSLLENLDSRDQGDIYQIKVRYFGEDPRISLRENDNLTNQEIEDIISRLVRLDKFSNKGDWTRDVLLAIRDQPLLRAADLSVILGREKEWLKPNIRKLKNLGLTISHEVGYTLSPRGSVVLEYMLENPPKT